MPQPPADDPKPYKPRHTSAQRAMLALNIVLVIACLVGAIGLIWGKSQLDDTLVVADGDISTTTASPGTVATTAPGDTIGDTSTTETPGTFPQADPQAQNFLITGSDANACVEPNSPWAGAADPSRDSIGSRSDTIMVMRIDPVTHQAAVLSFPRDLWVKIPGKGKNRINSAYVKNDPALLKQTLYDNFGVQIDHYVQVDFCAFKLIVDAVGGVTIPFSTRIVDKHVNLDVPAGCHTFSGDEALAYARSRHLTWIDENGKAHEDRASDLGRISRQQDFLRRTLEAAVKKGVFNPSVAGALIESMQKYIVRDDGLGSLNDMLKFAGVLKDLDPSTIRTYQIEASRLIVSGNDVLDPKIKGDNMKAILAIFKGEAPLAGAPEQVFETTTTVTGTTVPGGSTTTTLPVDTTTTVAEPEQNVKGDILPDPNVSC